MGVIKRVHIGTIQINGVTQKTFVRGRRKDIISELNGWLFDYLYSNSHPIQHFPPLDDWERSTENVELWSIAFPSNDWLVSIHSEIIEF